MLDVEKLVKSILAFINFFAIRIVVSAFLFFIIYSMAGAYWFDLARTSFSNSAFAKIDLTAYIELLSTYVTASNVKNTLFAVALIISLSLMDILYRAVNRIGGLLPVTMIYDLSYSTSSYRPQIQEAWRYYSKKFNVFSFVSFVEEKAAAERAKISSRRWWKSLFDYSKSFIVIVVIIYIMTPGSALQIGFLSVLYYCCLALLCMFVCTIIESARYANDTLIALRSTTYALISDAKDPKISDDEFRAAVRDFSLPPHQPLWRRSRYFCVHMTVAIPYFGSFGEWVSSFRRARRARQA